VKAYERFAVMYNIVRFAALTVAYLDAYPLPELFCQFANFLIENYITTRENYCLRVDPEADS